METFYKLLALFNVIFLNMVEKSLYQSTETSNVVGCMHFGCSFSLKLYILYLYLDSQITFKSSELWQANNQIRKLFRISIQIFLSIKVTIESYILNVHWKHNIFYILWINLYRVKSFDENRVNRYTILTKCFLRTLKMY